VLFYEVGKDPDTKFKGSKTMFALGTVTSERVYIPEEDQFFGNKRWIFKRAMSIDFIVPPPSGVPLPRLKEILGLSNWPMAGFRIYNTDQFRKLESELRKCQRSSTPRYRKL